VKLSFDLMTVMLGLYNDLSLILNMGIWICSIRLLSSVSELAIWECDSFFYVLQSVSRRHNSYAFFVVSGFCTVF